MRYVLLLVMMCLSVEATPPNLLRELGARRRAMEVVAFPTNGLVAYWSMDSVSGDTVFDTWSTNNATTTGSPLFGAEYGKRLDGVNFVAASSQSMVSDNNASISDYPFTISFWAKPVAGADFSTGENLVYAGVSQNNTRSYSHMLQVGDTGARIFGRGTSFTWSDYTFPASTTNYVHAVGVFEHTTKRVLYINGQSVVTNTASVTYTSDASRMRIYAGRNVAFHTTIIYSSGSADEIAFFNRAISSNEVSELYNDGAGRFYTP